MELMPYLQIREARHGSQGGEWDHEPAVSLHVCGHPAASWNLPSHTWAVGCPSSLRKQERVVRRDSSRQVRQTAVVRARHDGLCLGPGCAPPCLLLEGWRQCELSR